MNHKLIIGAVGALLLGGAAIAQTAQQNDPAAPAGSPSMSAGQTTGQAADQTAGQSSGQTDRSMTPGAAAPTAGSYGADTAGAADDQSMQMAGERG